MTGSGRLAADHRKLNEGQLTDSGLSKPDGLLSTRITTKAADQPLRRGAECSNKLNPAYLLNAYEISGPLRPRPNFQLTPSARMMPDAALPS